MTRFIDDHKQVYGVEPMCAVLPIAPSTYYASKSRPLSGRALADQELEKDIQRIYDENYGVYGVRKVWRQLRHLPPVPSLSDASKALVVKDDGQVGVVELVPLEDFGSASARNKWRGYVFVSTRDELERLRVAKAVSQVLAAEGVRVSERAFSAAGLDPNEVANSY